MKPWIIRRNTERYHDYEWDTQAVKDRRPDYIVVFGTQAQAEHVAEYLSFGEAGCQYYFYVEGVDDVDS